MYICYGSIPTFIQDLHLQIYAISATLLSPNFLIICCHRGPKSCSLLKVLSSEMDAAEISFTLQVVLKSEEQRILEKSTHPPSYQSPSNLRRHLVQLLAIWKQLANGAHSSVSGLFFTTYSCWQRRYEQICNLFTMKINILDPECYFLWTTAL